MAATSTSLYSLRKSRHALHTGYRHYRKKATKLPADTRFILETDLEQLDQAIEQKNRKEADALARKLEKFYATHFKMRPFDHLLEIIIAVILAIAIAVVVRQMWFELYEIPTGSMRPTFKEQDHLIVSKTTFGINTPLATDHLLFEPSLVKRGGAIIWSGDKVDLPDTDSTFLGIFPYKKRYIKRLIGKPGDTLYFYGGRLYGIDKEGREISDFKDNPWLHDLDHIPFITFEGRYSTEVAKGKISQLLFSQMGRPIGRLALNNYREADGEIFNGHSWIKDNPLAQRSSHPAPASFSDFWGMRNFAMARLLTKDQLTEFSNFSGDISQLKEAPLYLELRHHPSLTYPKPRLFSDRMERLGVFLTPLISVIPLEQHHIDALMDNMYTARFVVHKGHAKRYEAEPTPFTPNDPTMPGIPDGTYEFYYGKASKISWGGISEELPKTDPLYNHKPQFVQKLFNLGTTMMRSFDPLSKNQILFPHRYAYFRSGTLYVMGTPLLHENDPTLVNFLKREEEQQARSSEAEPYTAFKDYGPPLHQNGKIDKAFIQSFGIKVPDKHYLVLGDNYSNSADSRDFGFVPEANLQGTPILIIWPPGKRWGWPPQLPYPLFTLPRLIIWGVVALIIIIVWIIHRRRMRKPRFIGRK